MGQPMTDSPKQSKTSISLRPQDRERLAELGLTATEAVRMFCAGEAPTPRARALQTAETLALLDPTAKDPSDHLPEPPPVGAHGWTRQGSRHIARPASLDELARLVSTAPGPVRLAASHVLIVAEVSNG